MTNETKDKTRRTLHMSMAISLAIQLAQESPQYFDDGALEALIEMRGRGDKLLQLSECDGWNPVTGCPGHEVQS